MKKTMRLLLPLAVAALTAACNGTQKELLRAEFEGGVQDKVYLTLVPLNGAEAVTDTLTVQNGIVTLDMEIDAPADVTLELEKDRKAYGSRKPAASEAYRINFLLQPGEKVCIKAGYEDNYLKYSLFGSEALRAQSQLREEMRNECVKIGLLYDQIVEAMANGVENVEEAYVDSIYDAYEEAVRQKAKASLRYIEQNTGELLSGYLLLKHPDREVFLEYLPLLDSAVVNGALKEKIEQVRQNAEYMRQIRQNAEKLAPGALAPDFTLVDLNGKEVSLSGFANRYVVLDFWGTWCPWCVKGVPQMKEYQAKYKNKVTFISIACRDKIEKVKAFVQQENIVWLNLMNGTEDADVAFLYGVSGYPTKILLEPGLKVQNRYIGEVPEFYQDLDNLK